MPNRLRLLAATRAAPLVALSLILLFSFGARVFRIEQPCYDQPCLKYFSQPIFDEAYYVNAARTIDGLPQLDPAVLITRGDQIINPPSGDDPNPEHPQLAKLVIAGAIKVFGDDAWGWRLGSVVFSLVAMVAFYALIIGAGGGPWLAVGAVAVMALDNLMLVMGRIGMLDVYALAMMLIAGAFYVRRRPILAGIALGIGGCMKEVALYLLAALVLFEAASLAQRRWARHRGADPQCASRRDLSLGPGGFVVCALSALATFFVVLWVMDILAPPWSPYTQHAVAINPFGHFSYMVKFAEGVTVKSQHALTLNHQLSGLTKLKSTPLQWLIDQRPMPFANKQIAVTSTGTGAKLIMPIKFRGEITPFIIFLALPALIVAGVKAWRGDRVALLGASWAVGTFAVFFAQSEVFGRTSYLYYMLVVMPGIYLMLAQLFSARCVPRLATIAWAALVIFGFLHLYPARTLASVNGGPPSLQSSTPSRQGRSRASKPSSQPVLLARLRPLAH